MHCTHCGQWAPDTDSTCAQCGAPLHGPAAPVVVAAPLQQPVRTALYGGFWRRAWAILVDAILLFFPHAILRVGLGLPTFGNLFEDYMDHRAQIAFVVQCLLTWLYFAGMESSRARGTLGKQLLGLRVATAHGSPASFLRTSVRHFAKLLSQLLCFTGYLFNLWTPRRQTLHDLVAGCAVERTPGAQPVTVPGLPATP